LLDEHREIEPPDSSNGCHGANEPGVSPAQSPVQDLGTLAVDVRSLVRGTFRATHNFLWLLDKRLRIRYV